MNCLLVLALAVIGASAAPCVNNVNNGCGCQCALPGPSTHVQTAVVEHTPSFVPSYIPPTSVSQSCHCLKTVVRPQIRNEIITVPTVDRLVRTVTSPVVDTVTVNCGGNTRNVDIPTCSCGNAFPGNCGGSLPGCIGGTFTGVAGNSFPGVLNVGGYGCGCGCGCGCRC